MSSTRYSQKAGAAGSADDPPARRSSQPRRPGRGLNIGAHYDPDAFGRFSEGIARFLGTGRFLFIQTVLVVFWITINAVAVGLRWDPYPFILLNLAFSTQAAYAAPLILLAQNRQDERDRAQAEQDRAEYARTQADTEYLARELASVRLARRRMSSPPTTSRQQLSVSRRPCNSSRRDWIDSTSLGRRGLRPSNEPNVIADPRPRPSSPITPAHRPAPGRRPGRSGVLSQRHATEPNIIREYDARRGHQARPTFETCVVQLR